MMLIPVYTFHPQSGDIRREPWRMPVGPKRAPGLAVTPYKVLTVCASRGMNQGIEQFVARLFQEKIFMQKTLTVSKGAPSRATS